MKFRLFYIEYAFLEAAIQEIRDNPPILVDWYREKLTAMGLLVVRLLSINIRCIMSLN